MFKANSHMSIGTSEGESGIEATICNFIINTTYAFT